MGAGGGGIGCKFMFFDTIFNVFIYDPISLTAPLWCRYDNFYYTENWSSKKFNDLYKITASGTDK